MTLHSLAPFIGIGSILWLLGALIAAIFPGNRKRRLLHALVAFGVLIGAVSINGPTSEELAVSAAQKAKVDAVTAENTLIDYQDRLETQLNLISGFAAKDFTSGVKSIMLGVEVLNAAVAVYAEGKSLDLSEDAKQLREKLKKALASKQATALPIFRDAYGPAMREVLWEADGKARTFGGGFRTIELINVAFAANKNIKAAHTELLPALMRLRFTRAQYKWVDADVEYQFYTISPPKDAALVQWKDNGTFTPVD